MKVSIIMFTNLFRYIFISVASTGFLWLVFLPTYFMTFYAYHQAALLAFCLILNASLMLLCLYVPKLYAIYWIDEDQLVFNSSVNSVSTGVTKVQVLPANNQVEPVD